MIDREAMQAEAERLLDILEPALDEAEHRQEAVAALLSVAVAEAIAAFGPNSAAELGVFMAQEVFASAEELRRAKMN